MKFAEAAFYNRVSGKAHAYLRYFEPKVLKQLELAVEEDIKAGRYRCNSRNDILFALKTPVVSPETPSDEDFNKYYENRVFSTEDTGMDENHI